MQFSFTVASSCSLTDKSSQLSPGTQQEVDVEASLDQLGGNHTALSPFLEDL
jgi:hypothetical protein